MRIVIAPDSFKGCLSAKEVCLAIETGILRVWRDAHTEKVPMADGGEGTVAALVDATGGRYVTERVIGPLGKPVEATFGVLGDAQTAVIEMAAASGLPLLPPRQRNPLLTTTYGTGQLIKAALDLGCRKLIIGIGGSATNDCGAGMAQALGARMYAQDRGEIMRVAGGKLIDIGHIDEALWDDRVREAEFRVACDVDNPLYGPSGAAYIYGPQKGATPEMVEELDRGLRHFAAVIEHDLGKDVADIPGAGAAGGMGAGLMAFCDARLEPGVEIVIDAVGLRQRMHGADLCITGEGKIDEQTAFGKTPSGVAEVAQARGVPVVALGGAIAQAATALHEHGFTAIFSSTTGPISLAEAVAPERAKAALSFVAEEIARAMQAGRGLPV